MPDPVPDPQQFIQALDFDLATWCNVQGMKALGRFTPENLSEVERQHIDAIVVVAVAQANAATSVAYREVMYYNGPEPELTEKLARAVEAGFIEALDEDGQAYRISYEHADVPERAFPDYREWQYLF